MRSKRTIDKAREAGAELARAIAGGEVDHFVSRPELEGLTDDVPCRLCGHPVEGGGVRCSATCPADERYLAAEKDRLGRSLEARRVIGANKAAERATKEARAACVRELATYPCQRCGSLEIETTESEPDLPRVAAWRTCNACGHKELREAEADRLDLWRIDKGILYWTGYDGSESILRCYAVESVSMRRMMAHDEVEICTGPGYHALRIADGPALVHEVRELLEVDPCIEGWPADAREPSTAEHAICSPSGVSPIRGAHAAPATCDAADATATEAHRASRK